MTTSVWLLIALPLAGAAILLLGGKATDAWGHIVATLATIYSFSIGACLFGEMLNRFFALYTDIHLFNHLILILQPGGERLEWQENHNRRIPG